MNEKNFYPAPDEGIAIIGIGCKFPNADNKNEFWDNIINKVNGITDVPTHKWDPNIYYNPDKKAPDKTYSKIGGFVNPIDIASISKKFRIPPKTLHSMDDTQTYGIMVADDALRDSGYDRKNFDRERAAVIIGNAMGGEFDDKTNLRVFFSYIEDRLKNIESFAALENETQIKIIKDFSKDIKMNLPEITEDSMPGGLSNVIAGRIANTLNLNGPNYTTDAACASSMAAVAEVVKGLRMKQYDIAIAGGVDFMMGPGPYVKFSKVGALSADGSMPFDERANGFVMGEGVGMYVLKRVSDARKDGDKIYGIIRGVGASSDGKGKGITAPNPKGQILAIERAFEDSGFGPESIQLIEAHGTSTSVGDAIEVESLCKIFGNTNIKNNSIGLTSVKSMIGHLKAAAGSASIIKTALSLHNKKMGPSLNFEIPNSKMNFGNIPFRVVTDPNDWPEGINNNPRRAGISAFGFGGTNFHIIMEEDTGENGMPSNLKTKKWQGANFESDESAVFKGNDLGKSNDIIGENNMNKSSRNERDRIYSLSDIEKEKLEGETIVFEGPSWNEVSSKIDELHNKINSKKNNGKKEDNIRLIDISSYNKNNNIQECRLAVSAKSIEDLKKKLKEAKESLSDDRKWAILRNKGIFFGKGMIGKEASEKVALLFPGQGSQYINMMKDLYNKYSIVKETFDEADKIMTNIIGCGISEKIFLEDGASEQEMKEAAEILRKTEYTQPAILTSNIAMYRLLESFGINPDVVVGHSLGEYSALIVSGSMSLKDALIAVSARGQEMANVKVADHGKMASISTDYATVEEVLKQIDGYVIPANKNCYAQTVIAGNTDAVINAMQVFKEKGINVAEIPVSHAFHSNIVKPACKPYRNVLEKLDIKTPQIDVLSNLSGDYYPKDSDAPTKIVDILEKHMANPVEFVKQIERSYSDDVRIFIEVGPKKALTSFVMNVLNKKPHLSTFTNHPKKGGITTFNDALAALCAYGYKLNWSGIDTNKKSISNSMWRFRNEFLYGSNDNLDIINNVETPIAKSIKNYDFKKSSSSSSFLKEFKEKQNYLMKDLLDIFAQKSEELLNDQMSEAAFLKNEMNKYDINLEKVVISGISVGLPGSNYDVFGDNTFDRLLDGVNMIEPLTEEEKKRLVDKNITRLVKSSDGEPRFETIKDSSEVVKLAGKMGRFNFEEDYDFDKKISDGFDITTKLSIAASVEALKDAGLPLVQLYKETTTGKKLPDQWGLPENMQHDTGVVVGGAFPGGIAFAEELTEYLAFKYVKKSKRELIDLYGSLITRINDDAIKQDLSEWFSENYHMLEDADGKDQVYKFNNKFIFRILSLAHAQIAQYIKALGPNLQVNTACSSTVSAMGTAEDWIRTGRAKRVIVLATEALTHDSFLEWITGGFLALGAATTEEDYRKAAVPFDKRRNGTIIGMGAVGLVIEAESEVEKRGMKPIAELIATELANSGFHIGRLDQKHVQKVMNNLMKTVEKRTGLKRDDIIDKILFMSHETFTPRRGGSASAEVEALKSTFGDRYNEILISNIKGFTGHPIGAGIEDVAVIKSLQTGKVPPIANYKEKDEDLGDINLSKGGVYDNLEYGLRLAAGFGSQITMSFTKLISKDENRIYDHDLYCNWMTEMSSIKNPELEIVNRKLRIKDDGSILKQFNEKANNKNIELKKQEPEKKLPSIEPVHKSETNSKTEINSDHIKSRISSLVSEKTGYPEEMIEFDLDMESDLGIDTVKQAELFGTIREVFEIPKMEDLRIKDYPTLNHVVGFVKNSSPGTMLYASEEVQEVDTASLNSDQIRNQVSMLVSEKTGYPEDMIEFDLDMESDLGIDTVKQAELFGSIREIFEIPKTDGIKINDYPTLNHVVDFVKSNSSNVNEIKQDSIVSEKEVISQPNIQVEGDTIKKQVSMLVSEKTGYPEDMIEFDLDMESDLGIDTVKQAELFGSIREIFEIPKTEGIKINDYPTLNHVVDFVKSNSSNSNEVLLDSIVSEKEETSQPNIQDEDDAIKKQINMLVSEKTGYPEDMIEFDLDMESDLGIDTVKQAELFGTIREIFEIPKKEDLAIKDYPTLNHVVGFVKSNTKTALTKQNIKTENSINEENNEEGITESKIKRMTVEMIEEPLDKENNSRINFEDLNILITNDNRGIADSFSEILKKEKANVQMIDLSKFKNEKSLLTEIDKKRKQGSINGIIHLAGLSDSKKLENFEFSEWRDNTFSKIKSLFLIAKNLQNDLQENAKSKKSFLISATQMGGTIGFENFTDNSPICGGITGLTKSLNKELRDVLVKSIDFNNNMKPQTIAKSIYNEIRFGGDRVEVGYRGKKRMIPQVIYNNLDKDSKSGMSIEKDSTFIITGGGYGITAEIAKDLSKHFNPKIAIISIEKIPSNIKELASLDDKGLKELKSKLIEELKSKHDRVTPVMIDKEFGKYTRAIGIYENIEEMKKLGAGLVEYYECDVTNPDAMSKTINLIRETFGEIDGIIHGAGLEQSKLLEDKKYDNFCLVFDVKADGCFNLIELTKNDPVKTFVTFASISGRFGNFGQTDYSSANDLLNKYVQHSSHRFKGRMKAISMNWTGWQGVGMATRGSITKIFQEQGIDMIPLSDGIPRVREEILWGEANEITIAGNVGAIDSDKIIVGNNTKEFLEIVNKQKTKRSKYTMIDEILAFESGKSLLVKKRLDPEHDIYLKDHAIENVPYFPGVMGIEAFAQTTNLLFPDLKIQAMKNVKFLLPIKILKGKPVDILISLQIKEKSNDQTCISAKIETEFFNKDGIKLGDNKIHFGADITASNNELEAIKTTGNGDVKKLIKKFEEDNNFSIDNQEIYKRFFHGPKFQVHAGIFNLEGSEVVGILANPDPEIFSFVKKPKFISNPMASEAAFQNAGVYGMVKKNINSLPDTIEELTFREVPKDVQNLFVWSRHTGDEKNKHTYLTEVMDSKGNVYSSMKGYKMITIGELQNDEKF